MVDPMPGVEQADFRAGRRIDAGDLDALARIARPARQRQMGIGVRASPTEGHDVLHLEREVEDQFRRVVILAPMLGPLADDGICRIHPGESAIVRRRAAASSASTHRSRAARHSRISSASRSRCAAVNHASG